MLSLTAFFLAAATAGASDLPPGEGKEVVQRMCTSCHAPKVVTSKRASKTQWAQIVNQMVSRGAEGTDDEIETVVEYLSKNFGLDSPPPPDAKSTSAVRSVNVNEASADELSSALGFSAEESSAIVSFRQQNGKFKDWQCVTKVPGLAPGEVEKIKDRLRF